MYTPYRISGVLILTDVNGLVTNDSTNATTYCWRIYVERLRTLSMQKLIPNFTIINSTGIGKLTITTIQPHCPLMSGTFSLNFGGLNITTPSGSQNIPYGVSSSDLQKGFNKIIGFENVQVDTVWNDAGYSVQFIITYYGYNGLVPHLIPSNANLAGGKTNTKPQVYAEVLREYASDLLVDPIDYPFLKSSAAVPNVLVTVNSLLSVCLTNCAYTFTWDTPLFTSLSLSGSKLNIAISSSSYTYTLSDVSIIFNGSPCPIVDTTAPISNFQCQLPINSDNTPT